MKLITKIVSLLIVSIATFSSCIKEERVILNRSVVEFDAAAYNVNTAGQAYPIIPRLPQYGQPILTNPITTVTPNIPADPLITRTSGLIKFRINLVGAQRTTPTTITYQVVPTNTTAVLGTHFTTSGTVIIPANSSFGEVEIQILNPGATTSGPRDLVLELIGATDLPPSENEKSIGIRITQN